MLGGSCFILTKHWWWVKELTGLSETGLVEHLRWQHSLDHQRPADAIGSGMLVLPVWSDFRIGARSSWKISLPMVCVGGVCAALIWKWAVVPFGTLV